MDGQRDNYSRTGQLRRAPRRIYNLLKCLKRMANNFFWGVPNGLSRDFEGRNPEIQVSGQETIAFFIGLSSTMFKRVNALIFP